MPLYDYVCTNGHITEVMHGVHDSGPAKCERCGAEMRKLLSTPAIVFKGSGWAKKDRSSKPANKVKSSSDAHTTKPGSESGKSDSASSGTSGSGGPGPSSSSDG